MIPDGCWPKQMMGEDIRLGVSSLREHRSLQERREEADRGAADQIIPQVPDIRGLEEHEHQRLREERGGEDGRAAYEAQEKRDQEQAQDGAVKNRAKDIDRFDQILDQVGKKGERDRDYAPQ